MTTVAENLFPHTLIRASAGTGKTFQLSNRYLGLAVAGIAPDEILATTFTRKAAGEILERVLVRLAEAADDPSAAATLGRFLGDKLTSQRALHVLEGFVHHLHRLHISTLDSFFAQLARSFDLELGLPPGWRIVEESVDGRMKSEAIQAVLAERDPQENGPSGQDTSRASTFTLTLLHMLTKGEATRTIGEQLRTLVNGLYGLYVETAPEAWDSLPRPPRLTDEKLYAAIEELAEAPLPDDSRFASAREKDLAAARAGEWDEFIDGGLAGRVASGESKYHNKPIGEELTAIYKTLVRHARGVLVGQLADQTHATWQFLDKFHVHYRRLKLAKRALRFDDITRALAESGLSERSRQLSFRLDTPVGHVLLDEFQDTSLAQWNVLRPLVSAVMDGNGSFFCVGDMKQAIYGWRGGVAELFDAVGTAWPELHQPTLSESRRSAQPIIDTLNRVFDRLHSNPALDKVAGAVAGWQRGFEAHTTARRQLAGYVRMVTAPLAESDQEKVTLKFAAAEIKRIVGEAPGRSVGVLVRDNDAVANLIGQLRHAKISASEEGGNPLTDSPAVLVVLSLLTLADHPGNTAARFHVASSPLGAALAYTDHEDDLAAQRLSRNIRQQLLTEGYGPTIYDWAGKLAGHCDPRDASRLSQLVELAYRFEAEAGLRTRDFVAFVEHQRVEAPSPADVRVMTIHQAKGLQFDIVVLPQLDVRLNGQPPAVVVGRPEATAPADLVCRYANESLRHLLPDDVRAAFDRSAEQVIRESLCVLYVALTRPIHALHLVVAPSKPSEKEAPTAMSGVLREALTDGKVLEPETVVYEHGDRWWFRDGAGTAPKTPRAAANEERERSKETSFRVALAPAVRRRRVLERESPSELAHRAHVDLAMRLGLESSRAVNRGSAFHAWFEQVEWLEDGELEDAELRAVGIRTGATEGEVDEWLRQFRAKLENPRLRAVLSRATYLSGRDAPWAGRPEIAAELAGAPPILEVFRERPFAVRLRDTLLSGTFDRLLLVRNAVRRIVAAEVLDYKTDAVAAADPQAVMNIVERYRPQLSAYREAARVMFGLPNERVLTRLVVIEAGEVVEVWPELTTLKDPKGSNSSAQATPCCSTHL